MSVCPGVQMTLCVPHSMHLPVLWAGQDLSMCLSVHVTVQLSVPHPCVHIQPSVHPSIPVSMCPSVRAAAAQPIPCSPCFSTMGWGKAKGTEGQGDGGMGACTTGHTDSQMYSRTDGWWMDTCPSSQMHGHGWTHGLLQAQMYGQIHVQLDTRTVACPSGCMDGWMDTRTHRCLCHVQLETGVAAGPAGH